MSGGGDSCGKMVAVTQIHHLDGDPRNNDLDNLEVWPTCNCDSAPVGVGCPRHPEESYGLCPGSDQLTEAEHCVACGKWQGIRTYALPHYVGGD